MYKDEDGEPLLLTRDGWVHHLGGPIVQTWAPSVRIVSPDAVFGGSMKKLEVTVALSQLGQELFAFSNYVGEGKIDGQEFEIVNHIDGSIEISFGKESSKTDGRFCVNVRDVIEAAYEEWKKKKETENG